MSKKLPTSLPTIRLNDSTLECVNNFWVFIYLNNPNIYHYHPLFLSITLFTYPYFIYYSLAWGQTNATHFKPLIILQKKILCKMNRVPYFSHTNNFFKNRILKLEEIDRQYICIVI